MWYYKYPFDVDYIISRACGITSMDTIRPSHTLRFCTPAMGRSKALAMYQVRIVCDALRCIFQHVGNFSLDFGISQLYNVQFSNGFQKNDGNVICIHVIHNCNFSVKYF